MGVWIEIPYCAKHIAQISVTPLVGVWIEIAQVISNIERGYVTPLVGVWIEIAQRLAFHIMNMSLPLWECGLKSTNNNHR